MVSRKRGGSRGGSGLIAFVLTAGIALLLLVCALTALLAELMGTLMGAMLLLFLLFGAIAAVIYHYALREGFRELRSQLETIYDVAEAARWGYQKAIDYLSRIVKP